MTPIPVNLASIEAKHAKQESRQILAKQVVTKERLDEALSQTFNPLAVEKEQSRMQRFLSLKERKKESSEQTGSKKVQEVGKKSDEDLAKNYERRNYELPYNRLLALLRTLRENATPDEILKNVSQEFSDATLADEALEYLMRSTEGPLQNAIREAKERLNAEKQREIKAGINIDPLAKKFNKSGLGENPTELRELYRKITGSPHEVNELFSELAERYPYETLRTVLAFLFKALGYDLKSKGPSIQQAELLRLMTDCRNLQSILWVYLFFKARMKLIKKLYSQKKLKLSKSIHFEKLAKEFMKLVEERYPSVLKVIRQAENMGLVDSEKLIILSQWRDAIRQLSPRIYKSLKHRQDLLLVIIEALEDLEDKEIEEEIPE